ncbi:biotin/lipoyl-containing protein [Maribacter sp. 2307ULW6-5]|uniref:biotin/lipoyl-containing protein n=1 Tax=Maribacter sp. 2307ULW6-5 TaxID=3386275 RepID=UPI0039BD4E7B
MEKSHEVTVNGQFTFRVTEKDVKALDIIHTQGPFHHVLSDAQSEQVEVVAANFHSRTYTIRVNQTLYQVAISRPLDALIANMGFVMGENQVVKEIEAPMPGLILELAVKEGQEVRENDTLLVLEAMKMENTIVSPRDGVIKSIAIKKGDAVEKKQALITFE